DASSFGLGAVLMQREENMQWRPVAYISRSLSSTEQRYAQVEKEALAVTWACENTSSDYSLQ
ncbi:ribonuclease H family protein, partial [Bacillus amyloliquefaciens]|uniref:ribonuclease H family protein n=1 Tax=Bacillus amyloliquefaciens TaxID=1390 RepID=UPI001404E7E7